MYLKYEANPRGSGDMDGMTHSLLISHFQTLATALYIHHLNPFPIGLVKKKNTVVVL